MKKIFIVLLILLIPISAQALDKKLGATNSFKFGIFDISSKLNAGVGLTYNTHYIVKIQCGSNSVVTIDGTGDTITEEGGGYYRITFNDTVTNNPEEECLHWVEGAGIYAATADHPNLIAKTPEKFKAVGAMIDAVKIATAYCASTSGTSFTIGSCIDINGGSITLSTDKWVGSGMIAYTNGGAACNVESEYIMVGAMTSGGVVTARTIDVPNSGFKATPNTTNCGIKITP
jgi:hypothetical protein